MRSSPSATQCSIWFIALTRSQVRLLRGTERIIKPSWIVDSIAAGRLLPEADYSLLPDLGFPKPKTSFFTRPAAQLATNSAAQLAPRSSALISPPPIVPLDATDGHKDPKALTPESPELFLSWA